MNTSGNELAELKKCVNALYLELPQSVADDVSRIVNAYVQSVDESRVGLERELAGAHEHWDRLDKHKAWLHAKIEKLEAHNKAMKWGLLEIVGIARKLEQSVGVETIIDTARQALQTGGEV